MAKRQSHKESRLEKELLTTIDQWLLGTDAEQKDKLNSQYKILREEWEQVKWRERFRHDRNGDLIADGN